MRLPLEKYPRFPRPVSGGRPGSCGWTPALETAVRGLPGISYDSFFYLHSTACDRGRLFVATAALMDLMLDEIRKNLQARRRELPIYLYPELDSTNSRALSLATEGAPHGTLVVADLQTHGRGRFGRKWISPSGANLYLSLVLRPPDKTLRSAGLLTFMAAVAVVRCVNRLDGLEAEIKWPNDVLLDGRKVAGILAEQADPGQHGNSVVLGVGVNLNQSHGNLSNEMPDSATSIFAVTRQRVDRSLFCAWLVNEFDNIYLQYLSEGSGAVLKSWKAHSMTLGRRIRLADGHRIMEGTAEDVDEDGGLLVRADDGNCLKVFSGDVTLL